MKARMPSRKWAVAVVDDRDRLKTIHFVIAKLHADFFRVGVKGIPDQFGHGENRLRDADLPLKVVASNFDVDLLHGPLVRMKRTIIVVLLSGAPGG